MTDDLEQLLTGQKGNDTPPAPSADQPPKGDEPPGEKNDEAEKKQQQLANLDKAIDEANITLAKIRKDQKIAKGEPVGEDDEEDTPKIDFQDPSAKAWGKHIRQAVDPVAKEIEQAKQEIRTFALQEFLSQKPSLAKNPEKLKQLMETYDRLRTSTERTKEGVLLDLERSYAAVFHRELIGAARTARVEQAQADSIFSDIAISGGSSAQPPQNDTPVKKLTEDDKAVLAKWGVTPEEWAADKKKYG